MTVLNAFDPIEHPANVSLLQERGLSRYQPLSNIILPSHSQYLFPVTFRFPWPHPLRESKRMIAQNVPG